MSQETKDDLIRVPGFSSVVTYAPVSTWENVVLYVAKLSGRDALVRIEVVQAGFVVVTRRFEPWLLK